jgi:hypothetical protein
MSSCGFSECLNCPKRFTDCPIFFDLDTTNNEYIILIVVDAYVKDDSICLRKDCLCTKNKTNKNSMYIDYIKLLVDTFGSKLTKRFISIKISESNVGDAAHIYLGNAVYI